MCRLIKILLIIIGLFYNAVSNAKVMKRRIRHSRMTVNDEQERM
jgi:hypothetical protein